MKFRFSPIARKRIMRFKRHRRAYIAAWLLAGISLAALAANLLANSNPLFVRYEGRNFFPAFRFYSESTFIPDGGAGSADYKELEEKPIFSETRSNFMIFPPIRYGPSETIDEEKLADQTGSIPIQLIPIARAGSIDINADKQITRHSSAGFFLGVDDAEITNQQLASYWGEIDDELQDAIVSRFANEESPALSIQVSPDHLEGLSITISMPPFRPRPNPPRTVRMTLRLTERRERSVRQVSIIPEHGPATPPPEWQNLRESDRERLMALTLENLPHETPFEVEAGPYQYRVMPAAGIAWPHPPVRGHPFGIDGAGRDVLARVIHGLRVSLYFSLLLVVASMTMGTIIGAIQGYYGGKTDILLQRGIEIWSAIPFLYVMILLGSIYGTSFGLLLLCYAIFNWIGISFYMRGEFLRLRHAPFVDAARVLGLRDHRIILKHILPNALTPVITFAPFSLVGAIASLAALDYLGFGLPALTPSLGQLLHQAQTYRTAWWLVLYPSLTLFLVILLGVFIGEGVREACDPRPRIRLE